MNINDISTQLIYTTVPIYTQNQDLVSSGTGFIFSMIESDISSIPFLVTNYHVLENMENGYFELHIAKNNKPTNETIRIQFNRNILLNNKLENLDLVAIPIAGMLDELNSKGINLFYRTIDQNIIPNSEQVRNLSSMEQITFIGYPNGIYDTVNKIPVLRQGITATPIWNEFQGKKEFLIDAGVFPGSSGSPVFIYNSGSYPTNDGIVIGNRLLFVGIVTQTLQQVNENKNYLDLGIVINSNAMQEEINKLIEKIKKRQ